MGIWEEEGQTKHNSTSWGTLVGPQINLCRYGYRGAGVSWTDLGKRSFWKEGV